MKNKGFLGTLAEAAQAVSDLVSNNPPKAQFEAAAAGLTEGFQGCELRITLPKGEFTFDPTTNKVSYKMQDGTLISFNEKDDAPKSMEPARRAFVYLIESIQAANPSESWMVNGIKEALTEAYNTPQKQLTLEKGIVKELVASKFIELVNFASTTASPEESEVGEMMEGFVDVSSVVSPFVREEDDPELQEALRLSLREPQTSTATQKGDACVVMGKEKMRLTYGKEKNTQAAQFMDTCTALTDALKQQGIGLQRPVLSFHFYEDSPQVKVTVIGHKDKEEEKTFEAPNAAFLHLITRMDVGQHLNTDILTAQLTTADGTLPKKNIILNALEQAVAAKGNTVPPTPYTVPEPSANTAQSLPPAVFAGLGGLLSQPVSPSVVLPRQQTPNDINDARRHLIATIMCHYGLGSQGACNVATLAAQKDATGIEDFISQSVSALLPEIDEETKQLNVQLISQEYMDRINHISQQPAPTTSFQRSINRRPIHRTDSYALAIQRAREPQTAEEFILQQIKQATSWQDSICLKEFNKQGQNATSLQAQITNTLKYFCTWQGMDDSKCGNIAQNIITECQNYFPAHIQRPNFYTQPMNINQEQQITRY